MQFPRVTDKEPFGEKIRGACFISMPKMITTSCYSKKTRRCSSYFNRRYSRGKAMSALDDGLSREGVLLVIGSRF